MVEIDEARGVVSQNPVVVNIIPLLILNENPGLVPRISTRGRFVVFAALYDPVPICWRSLREPSPLPAVAVPRAIAESPNERRRERGQAFSFATLYNLDPTAEQREIQIKTPDLI